IDKNISNDITFNLMDMPDDIIRIIFDLLDQEDCINFCFCSKRYKNIYSNYCKSIKLKIDEDNYQDSVKQLNSLSLIANKIEELEIRGTSSYDIIVDDYILKTLSRHNSIKTIRFYYLTINN